MNVGGIILNATLYKSALSPGGIRLGTSSLTTRGFKENEFIVIAKLLHKLIQIAIEIQKISGKNINSFCNVLKNNHKLLNLKSEVLMLTNKFSD